MKRYIKTQAVPRREALKKWREYNDAVKKTDMKVYKDLKSVFKELKAGKIILDIFDVFLRAGVHEHNKHPKLAIAQATSSHVYCRYYNDGDAQFLNRDDYWGKVQVVDVRVHGMPKMAPDAGALRLKAPVPLIPPQLLPARLTKDYYVLWEVEQWAEIPPKDPYLLKRVTKNMFVVCGAWDLTELERSVMKGRM